MYVVTVEFEVREGRETEFLQRMGQQADDSLNLEPGCLQFDVCQAPDDPASVFLYEVYSDESAFRTHLESNHFKEFDTTVAGWLARKTVRVWRQIT